MNFKLKFKQLEVFFLLLSLPASLLSQTLQLHYDLRHSIDPGFNPRNYPSFVFEEWKSENYGSFDFKAQADLTGENENIGQLYVQVQQSLKLWKPDIFAFMEYSGGLGVVDPGLYGYHIQNSFSLGLSYLLIWEGTWFSPSIVARCATYQIPSVDPMFSLYWGRNFLNDRISFVGDFEIWTENRNHGDAATEGSRGKEFFFFGEPQLWYNLNKTFSVGSKINLYYHVLTNSDVFQIYPTLAVSYRF